MLLKEFQIRALERLSSFLREARKSGPKAAFEALAPGAYRMPMKGKQPVLAGDPPYVCLRIPTGGGKTLVAAHAVGRAFTDYLERPHGVVLWLVPSREIAEQTLRNLRWPRHAYRLALQNALGSEAIQVKTLPEAMALPLSEAMAETIVVVSTLQAFRVTATEGRKVYEDNGQLYPHREQLRAFQSAVGGLDCFEGTQEPLCSLRNLLAMHRPLVILDEAHNARTHLSFETLARLNPSCLIEFTATPDREDNPSNVLVQVPAAELKAEGLIKLPIELESASDPMAALGKAKSKREALEVVAQAAGSQEGRYVRPILLVQAQADTGPDAWTVERVRKTLVEEFKISEAHIAVATGTTRDLKGKNLFSPAEHTRVIVTQKALVEGWDCSFAYVLCALTESHSAKDVEQLLGRILRMPGATPFQNGTLNRAYGVLATTSFQQTVMSLREKFVVAHGFTKVEANQALQPASEPLLDASDPVEAHQASLVTLPPLDFTLLPEPMHAHVKTDLQGQPQVSRAYLARHLGEFVKATKDPTALAKVAQAELTPAQNMGPFHVPVLLYHGEAFRDEHFAAWPLPLDRIPVDLAFDPLDVRLTAQLDAKGAELAVLNVGASKEAPLPYGVNSSEDPVHLSQRLDLLLHRNGANRDVPQHLGRRWCLDLITSLISRGQALAELDRARFRLAAAVDQHWNTFREQFRIEGFSAALMDTAAFSSAPNQHFAFGPEDDYAPSTCSPSIYNRHRYLRVGSMNAEELMVAQALDGLPSVVEWVRNLEHSRTTCFWLQASLHAFFPDFVARLKDGRTLVVEYKGAHLVAKDQDKKAVGERWAAATGNAFEWVTEEQLPELLEAWFKRYGD
jgi:type III restriction enzyme